MKEGQLKKLSEERKHFDYKKNVNVLPNRLTMKAVA